MKIIKNSLVIFPALLLSMSSYAPVLALESGVSLDASVNVSRSSDNNEDTVYTRSTTSVNARMESANEREDDDSDLDSTSSRESNSDKKDWDDKSTTTATSTKSRSSNANEHRSAVATFVQNLLRIADRNGGIGAQVRVVAQEQNDSSTSTVELISKVEARSNFKTFLIGSDYKNLGMIRSELANTGKRIERLSALASSTTNAQLRTELNAEVKLRLDDLVKVTAFVNSNENRFSLFGWFVKIFVR